MINDSSATDDPTKDTGSTAGMSTWRARLLAEKIEKGQFVDYPEVGRALTFLLDDHFKLSALVERHEKDAECARQFKYATMNFLGISPAALVDERRDW